MTETGTDATPEAASDVAVAQHLPFTPFPREIHDAIKSVMSGIAPITKREENKFANFMYASVDQIYEAVGDLCVAADLVIVPIEQSKVTFRQMSAGGKEKLYGRFEIGFVLSVGDITYYEPRMCETLFVAIEGATTFNGVKSYAQKTFLRQLFKIPTGDFDLDGTKPESGDGDASERAKKGKKDAKEPKKYTADESKAARGKLIGAIEAIPKPMSSEDKEAFAEKYSAELAALLPEDANAVRTAFKAAMAHKGSA